MSYVFPFHIEGFLCGPIRSRVSAAAAVATALSKMAARSASFYVSPSNIFYLYYPYPIFFGIETTKTLRGIPV
jgi:hypothetical protein